jgi:hypothetical protein
MKIDFLNKHLKQDTLLSHLVLNGMTPHLKKDKSIIETPEYTEKGILDIELKVNGLELDVEKFCEMWQKQINESKEEILKNYVKEKYEDKFFDIDNLLGDLTDRLNREIDKRLEDWGGGDN